MTMISVRPNSSTLTGGWWATGGSASAVLSDDSNATYLQYNDPYGVATIGFPAMSVPAGARMVAAYLRLVTGTVAARQSGTLRPVLIAIGGLESSAVLVNWSTPQSINVVTMNAPPSAPNSFALTPPGPVRIYEATLYLRYVTKPVVPTVTLVSPPTQDDRPLIRWTRSFDQDGGEPTRYEIRVFNSSQDPDTGPWTWQEVGTGGRTERRLPSLPNDSYQVFVRVAQTVLGELLWSDWKQVAFTLNVPRPGVPTVNPAGEDSLAYVSLALEATGGSGATSWWEVQWSPDGASGWQPIFTPAGGGIVPNPGSGSAVAADYEPPNDATRFYRARAVTDNGGGYTATSAWSPVESGRWRSQTWWLKSVRYPGRNLPVSVASQPGWERDGRDGVFQGLGSPEAIVVSDVPGPPRGEIVFDVDEDVDRRKLKELVEAADPVLVQAIPGTHWQDRWVRLINQSRRPVIDKTQVKTTLERFDWIEVPKPE